MGTVFRIGVWRVTIYTLDHAPAHAHLVGQGGWAKIALNCPMGPALPIDVRGLDAVTVKKALRVIGFDQDIFVSVTTERTARWVPWAPHGYHKSSPPAPIPPRHAASGAREKTEPGTFDSWSLYPRIQWT